MAENDNNRWTKKNVYVQTTVVKAMHRKTRTYISKSHATRCHNYTECKKDTLFWLDNYCKQTRVTEDACLGFWTNTRRQSEVIRRGLFCVMLSTGVRAVCCLITISNLCLWHMRQLCFCAGDGNSFSNMVTIPEKQSECAWISTLAAILRTQHSAVE